MFTHKPKTYEFLPEPVKTFNSKRIKGSYISNINKIGLKS